MLVKNRQGKHVFLIIAVLWASISSGCGPAFTTAPPSPHIQVCFSPKGGGIQLVQESIKKAKKFILVQAYYFTSLPIANALIEAHHRGIEVRILVDRSQVKYKRTQIYRLAAQGIPVAIDQVPGSAHSKVMIIDEDYILTGSFNWTQAAEHRNVENLLLIRDPNINKIYREAWYVRAEKARPIPNKLYHKKKKKIRRIANE